MRVCPGSLVPVNSAAQAGAMARKPQRWKSRKDDHRGGRGAFFMGCVFGTLVIGRLSAKASSVSPGRDGRRILGFSFAPPVFFTRAMLDVRLIREDADRVRERLAS